MTAIEKFPHFCMSMALFSSRGTVYFLLPCMWVDLVTCSDLQTMVMTYRKWCCTSRSPAHKTPGRFHFCSIWSYAAMSEFWLPYSSEGPASPVKAPHMWQKPSWLCQSQLTPQLNAGIWVTPADATQGGDKPSPLSSPEFLTHRRVSTGDGVFFFLSHWIWG